MKQTHHTTDELARMIHAAGVRVSAPRLAILDYIANGKTHPSADEIFGALHETYPRMSRTTVYNSLHVLMDAGLVRLLEIDSGVMRYDMGRQKMHGHFLCRKCGRVFDLPLPKALRSAPASGFLIDNMEWNCKGLCPDCHVREEEDVIE